VTALLALPSLANAYARDASALIATDSLETEILTLAGSLKRKAAVRGAKRKISHLDSAPQSVQLAGSLKRKAAVRGAKRKLG
jgi:hypothetical protein